MTNRQALENFQRDQREALLSLNEQTIRAFAAKWGAKLPREAGDVFWGAVHKARTALKSLPIEERRKSKAWLDERKLSSWDDGEL